MFLNEEFVEAEQMKISIKSSVSGAPTGLVTDEKAEKLRIE